MDVLSIIDIACCVCEFLDFRSIIRLVSACGEFRLALNNNTLFFHISSGMFSRRFWYLASHRSQLACSSVRLELERIERFQMKLEKSGGRWGENEFIEVWRHEPGYPTMLIETSLTLSPQELKRAMVNPFATRTEFQQ